MLIEILQPTRTKKNASAQKKKKKSTETRWNFNSHTHTYTQTHQDTESEQLSESGIHGPQTIRPDQDLQTFQTGSFGHFLGPLSESGIHGPKPLASVEPLSEFDHQNQGSTNQNRPVSDQDQKIRISLKIRPSRTRTKYFRKRSDRLGSLIALFSTPHPSDIFPDIFCNIENLNYLSLANPGRLIQIIFLNSSFPTGDLARFLENSSNLFS